MVNPLAVINVGPTEVGKICVLQAWLVTAPLPQPPLYIIICMPNPFKLLVTHTLNEVVVEVAINFINELFSITLQNAAVNCGQVSAV